MAPCLAWRWVRRRTNQALLSATKAKRLIRLELSAACEGCLGRALLVLAQWSPFSSGGEFDGNAPALEWTIRRQPASTFEVEYLTPSKYQSFAVWPGRIMLAMLLSIIALLDHELC